MRNASVAGKKYLYAVVAGSGDRKYNYCGIDGTLVHSISTGRVSAVVSDVNFHKIRPERRNLATHQKVISKLVEEKLSPTCLEIRTNKCRTEREVMNLACLVGRDAHTQFESVVLGAAKLFD